MSLCNVTSQHIQELLLPGPVAQSVASPTADPYIIFLSIYLNMCFVSHRDGCFKYSQHMFWLRNKKNNFQLHNLIWGPDLA